MEKITTHVLDTSAGIPAANVRVRLSMDGTVVADIRTNVDGRCDSPLVLDPAPGCYELVFSIGGYYISRGIESPFLDEVPIRFHVASGQSYHIPLLASPWAYSTYRGS